MQAKRAEYIAISTHALTWSATPGARKNYENIKNFNSRAHVERDRQVYIFDDDFAISTHALTWSATNINDVGAKIANNFNSRAHVERDQIVYLFF